MKESLGDPLEKSLAPEKGKEFKEKNWEGKEGVVVNEIDKNRTEIVLTDQFHDEEAKRKIAEKRKGRPFNPAGYGSSAGGRHPKRPDVNHYKDNYEIR